MIWARRLINNGWWPRCCDELSHQQKKKEEDVLLKVIFFPQFSHHHQKHSFGPSYVCAWNFRAISLRPCNYIYTSYNREPQKTRAIYALCCANHKNSCLLYRGLHLWNFSFTHHKSVYIHVNYYYKLHTPLGNVCTTRAKGLVKRH